jgi:hypothetical protein
MSRLNYRYCSVLILLLVALPVHAQCNKSTVQGRYGFVSSTRTTSKPGGATIKVRFAGLLYYDGAGVATGAGLLVGPTGDPKKITVSGTYDVAAECTGQVKLSDENHSQTSWRFVVVNSANELLTISEKSSDTTPFSQKKQ